MLEQSNLAGSKFLCFPNVTKKLFLLTCGYHVENKCIHVIFIIESEHCLGSLVCRCPFSRFGPFVHSSDLTLFDICEWFFWGVLPEKEWCMGPMILNKGHAVRIRILVQKNEPALKQSSCKQLWTVLGDLLSLLLLLPLLAPFSGLTDFDPILLLSAVLASHFYYFLSSD